MYMTAFLSSRKYTIFSCKNAQGEILFSQHAFRQAGDSFRHVPAGW